MPEIERDLLLEAALEAGEIALGYFGNNPKSWAKADESPVTEADLAVNDMLQAKLMAARPAYGWLSEESETDPTRQAADRVFIIDPIDGTRAFVEGTKAFGHSLAIAEQGRIIAGVVHMPALEKTYAAAIGKGATLNGRPIAAARNTSLETAQILSNATTAKSERWQPPLPQLDRHFRPSLAYRLCLVAEGRFDAALTLRDVWEWDVAAGDLICAEAGATASTPDGSRVTYNAETAQHPGLVVASDALHGQFIARLKGV